jgi:hypothetical protein
VADQTGPDIAPPRANLGTHQAIFNLLSQRVILPPDLQQQLDNGMRAFMANLFG